MHQVTFNTKKVRLKHRNGQQVAVSVDDFQYQKGAIKTFLARTTYLYFVPFNTKKVRLKHRKLAEDLLQLRLFQYQKGAIKTVPVGVVRFLPDENLSIPKRCD